MRLDQPAEHPGGVDERKAGNEGDHDRAHCPSNPAPMRREPSGYHEFARLHRGGEHDDGNRRPGKYFNHARD
jgi:hypothetical protein